MTLAGQTWGTRILVFLGPRLVLPSYINDQCSFVDSAQKSCGLDTWMSSAKYATIYIFSRDCPVLERVLFWSDSGVPLEMRLLISCLKAETRIVLVSESTQANVLKRHVAYFLLEGFAPLQLSSQPRRESLCISVDSTSKLHLSITKYAYILFYTILFSCFWILEPCTSGS